MKVLLLKDCNYYFNSFFKIIMFLIICIMRNRYWEVEIFLLVVFLDYC